MMNLKVTEAQEKEVKVLGFLRNRGTDNFSARVGTVNGKITVDQLRCIADAAEKFGNGQVLFTTRLSIQCPGIPYEKIEEFRNFIAKEGLFSGGTGPKVRPVVSCKGTTCKYGLIDTYVFSEEIHEIFYNGYRSVKLPHKFKIAVGGCPNSCVKPSLNDVGIVGQMKPNYNEELCHECKRCTVEEACPMGAAKTVDGILKIDDEICINCGLCIGKCAFGAIEDGQQGYKVYIGGRWGKQINLGTPLHKMFTDKEEVISIIEKVILIHKEQGESGERVAQTVERIGFENIETQLYSNEILEKKEEILYGEVHADEGATP